jgi:hypothetical protein
MTEAPELLRRSDFAARLHQRFRAALPEGALDLDLDDVAAPGRVSDDGGDRDRPFSLVFSAPPSPALRQGIHRLEHPDLGILEVFLVPIGPGRDGLRYEAVFN